ncbi:MAG: M15 family metallopeptidase [Pseudomonadota bacterium]
MNDLAKQQVEAGMLLGVTDSKLILAPEFNCVLHPLVIEPLTLLAMEAQAKGFSLRVASSYRNFERQLLIWNRKASGIRVVLDKHGEPLDIATLNDKEKVFAILRWSALPGSSRHHWGTDIDVYDASRIDVNYSLQLTLAETQNDGPFAEFHRWLSSELNSNARGFYRPYDNSDDDNDGVAPEPWHLSYAPVASLYGSQMNEEILREQILLSEIALKETVLENLDEIYQRFIKPYC